MHTVQSVRSARGRPARTHLSYQQQRLLDQEAKALEQQRTLLLSTRPRGGHQARRPEWLNSEGLAPPSWAVAQNSEDACRLTGSSRTAQQQQQSHEPETVVRTPEAARPRSTPSWHRTSEPPAAVATESAAEAETRWRRENEEKKEPIEEEAPVQQPAPTEEERQHLEQQLVAAKKAHSMSLTSNETETKRLKARIHELEHPKAADPLENLKNIVLGFFFDSPANSADFGGDSAASCSKTSGATQTDVVKKLKGGKKLDALDVQRLLAAETVEELVANLCSQMLEQHNEDVNKQFQLQNTANKALQLAEDEQLLKTQVIADKDQLEAKLNWLKDGMKAEECAYRVIKKNIRPWILRMRVHKLLAEGAADKFKSNLHQRDCKVIDMVHLLGSYGKQMQVLYAVYLVPMERFFEEKAFTLGDPNGFELKTFVEYKRAIHKLAILYKQVEEAVNKLKDTEGNSVADHELVLFEQVRQMHLSRGVMVQLMNRQQAVNLAVRKYKAADKEFSKVMAQMKEESAALGVGNGFDYISGFLSLQTICYMEDHLMQLTKLTGPENPHSAQVKISADMLTALKMWLDEQLGHQRKMTAFQNRVPLTEVSIISERRKLLHSADLLKLYPASSGHGEELKPIHVALFTDCLILCGIRQSSDEAVAALMVPFMQTAGRHDDCAKGHEWSPPCDVTIKAQSVTDVLMKWWKVYKGLKRSPEELQTDLDLCVSKSQRFEEEYYHDNSTFTFAELTALLKPLKEKMGFEKAPSAQYRFDTVLGVQSGITATHLAGGRFKIGGAHFQISQGEAPMDSMPVEVTVEADDEATACKWVSQINGALAQHQEISEDLDKLELAFRHAVGECDEQMGGDNEFFPSTMLPQEQGTETLNA